MGENMKSLTNSLLLQVRDLLTRRVGVLYLITITFYLLVGLAAALAMQLDLWTPSVQLLGPDWFGKVLTGHGMLMVFLVLLPLFPGVFGHLVLPASLGRQQLPMPLTSASGWMCHFVGGILVLLALLLGGYEAGWVMMMPVAGISMKYVLLLIGLILAALSVLLPSLVIVRAVLWGRAGALTLSRLPLIGWFVLFGSIVQILVTPVRLYTLVGLVGNHLWGWSIFTLGNPDSLAAYQKQFWLYAGPATAALILPALGLLFETLAARTKGVAAHRTLIVGSGFVLMLLGLLSWSQHLISTAGGELVTTLGAFFGILMIVPAAILVAQLARLALRAGGPSGAVDWFVLLSIVSSALAGLAGGALALPALSVYLHNTYFTAAHLHLAAVGTLGGAILAGLYHFWPHWWQARIPERIAKWSAVGMLVGVTATFLPMLALGAQGSPRSLYLYPEPFRMLHQVSTLGTVVLIAALMVAIFALFVSAVRRDTFVAEPDPPAGEFSYTAMTVRSSRQ